MTEVKSLAQTTRSMAGQPKAASIYDFSHFGVMNNVCPWAHIIDDFILTIWATSNATWLCFCTDFHEVINKMS